MSQNLNAQNLNSENSQNLNSQNPRKRLTIAILTFWWSRDNYGQQMQAYALRKYLCDLGHHAYLIAYHPAQDCKKTPLPQRLLKALNPIKLSCFIYNKIKMHFHTRAVEREHKEYPRFFSNFREQFLEFGDMRYSSLDELRANAPKADIYIVGSDQVWNTWTPDEMFHRIRDKMRAYYLDFGAESIVRAAYAASFGRADIGECERAEIAPLLQKFSFVSVRESQGVQMCKKAGYERAHWVCDPTLLLDSEIYRQLYKSQNAHIIDGVDLARAKPYVMFYYLDNGGDFDTRKVYEFAKSKGLEVRYVTANEAIDSAPKIPAQVPQWLALIDNARYVITNSFHGCVFCILFGKQFGAIALNGRNESMNTRLESLFAMTGCGERYLTDSDFSILDVSWELGEFEMRAKSKKLFNEFLDSVSGVGVSSESSVR